MNGDEGARDFSANFSAREVAAAWSDPQALAEVGRRMSGLEFLRSTVEGDLPQLPLGDTLAFRLVEADHGVVAFRCSVDARHYNNIGSVHGGLPAALIDSACGCAVFSTLERGDAWTTLGLSIDFLRPPSMTGELRCEGHVVRVGRRSAVADAELYDADGRLCAKGSSQCLIMRGHWLSGPKADES